MTRPESPLRWLDHYPVEGQEGLWGSTYDHPVQGQISIEEHFGWQGDEFKVIFHSSGECYYETQTEGHDYNEVNGAWMLIQKAVPIIQARIEQRSGLSSSSSLAA